MIMWGLLLQNGQNIDTSLWCVPLQMHQGLFKAAFFGILDYVSAII